MIGESWVDDCPSSAFTLNWIRCVIVGTSTWGATIAFKLKITTSLRHVLRI